MCYWPGMGTTVTEVCDSCERCQKRKTPATRSPLRQLNMKTGPNLNMLNTCTSLSQSLSYYSYQPFNFVTGFSLLRKPNSG